MKQSEKESFQTRQRWERKMRLLFSQTLRTHMRDPALYTPEKTWSAAENAIAETILTTLRSNPEAGEEELYQSTKKRRSIVKQVWEKLNTFPHIFEVLAARGEDLMRYDLHGEARSTAPLESQLSHLTYRGWSVSLADFDALLEKGTLEVSTWEMLAHVLRTSLPHDVLLRQAHVLRKQKTGLEHFSKHSRNPRIQIFPYRSNSKQWAMFLVTRNEDDRYSLRAVLPMDHDKEAFSWAIKHLQFQYSITEEPTYATWPSNVGAQILVAEGLVQALSDSRASVSQGNRESFVAATLRTLRSLRDAAVRAYTGDVDELCYDDYDLRRDFGNLFESILPEDMLKVSSTHTPWHLDNDDKSNAHWRRRAPSPMVKRKRDSKPWTSERVQKWRDDEDEWKHGSWQWQDWKWNDWDSKDWTSAT